MSNFLQRFTPHPLPLALLLLLLLLTTGCSNIIRSGLMNSNTIFLDPNTNRTVYT